MLYYLSSTAAWMAKWCRNLSIQTIEKAAEKGLYKNIKSIKLKEDHFEMNH
jgi:hypothetical protein